MSKTSNTTNPFANMNAEEIKDLISSTHVDFGNKEHINRVFEIAESTTKEYFKQSEKSKAQS